MLFSSHFSDAIPRNEACLAYVAVTRDAAQHRYWAFYDAINVHAEKVTNWRKKCL